MLGWQDTRTYKGRAQALQRMRHRRSYARRFQMLQLMQEGALLRIGMPKSKLENAQESLPQIKSSKVAFYI
jgi:hypothetical protein